MSSEINSFPHEGRAPAKPGNASRLRGARRRDAGSPLASRGFHALKFGGLLGTTCVGSLAFLASPALAQTSVSGDSTTPLTTSTAGNVTIQRGGELEIPSGTAVTVNSSNNVTLTDDDPDVSDDVEGRITVGEGNGATGIAILPGVTTTIANGGTISVLEDFDPEDEDANGLADGPLAEGSNRYGIHLLPGGSVTGTITNSGLITVEGLNSGGIVLDSTLNGSLAQTGTIRVVGDNSVGVRTGDVNGNIVMEGSTTVTGRGARALSVEGDVSGSIRIQGTVGHSVAFAHDNGGTIYLSRFDLRLNAPAVAIEGNVAGGIIVAARPLERDSADTDEDDDGVTDSEEGTGNIIANGNGPALLIGSDQAITIGTLPAANGGYSLAINGSVSGTATYSSTDAYGVVIGGLGGTVNLPGGIGINGSLTATTSDSAATALLINQGATVASLYNSGAITATISSQGEGEAYGIYDRSGSLTLIENTGFISAIGSSTDIVQAINLSSATSDVTISQFMNADDLATRADIEEDLDEGESDTTVYTSITGNIVTGSGNDTLQANAGQITGSTYFNDGNDRLLLSGDVAYNGRVFFGNGGALAALSGEAAFAGRIDFAGQAGLLTLADDATFAGMIVNGNAASVVVNGGRFGTSGVETFHIGSLTVNSGGTLNAYIDGDTHTSSLITAGTASFQSGATVAATINSLEGAEGSYVILSAGTITGNPIFDEATTALPYIFSGSVSVDSNQLTLTIRRKLASELGLTRPASSAYDAILTAALSDDIIAQSFLDITDSEALEAQIAQMLPDYAGGLFDTTTRATRLAAQHLMDNNSLFTATDPGDMAFWLEPVLWRSSRDATETSAYRSNGWGFSGGVEWLSPIGWIGGSFAWIGGDVENNGGTNNIGLTQYDLGAFWRVGRSGPVYAYARLGAARTSFSSERIVSVTADETDYTYATAGAWHGWLFSGMAGISYKLSPTRRFFVRPKLGLEWFRLQEDGYTESGGGDAVDLTVAGRRSSSLSVNSTVTLAYALTTPEFNDHPLTLEAEAGRRTVLSGQLGSTQANFVDGNSFTLTPDSLEDAWTGELRLSMGGRDYLFQVAAGAERSRSSDLNYSGRASVSLSF